LPGKKKCTTVRDILVRKKSQEVPIFLETGINIKIFSYILTEYSSHNDVIFKTKIEITFLIKIPTNIMS
jgi:hypothetical protein